MRSPSPPPQPDPAATAGAQTANNVSTAIAQGALNNVNQVTPFGNLTFEQTGTYQMTDPNTGDVYNVPLTTATQTLSDSQQSIFDQSQAAELNLATLANERSEFLGDYMGDTFSYDPDRHMDWSMGLYDRLSERDNARQMEQLNSTLAQQGLMPGSEAYDRALGQMLESQTRSRDQFALDSYGQGFNTAITERNQPINEISGLLSQSQIEQPSFITPNTPQLANVDRAGLEMDAYNKQMQAWQMQNNNRNQMMGGLFGLASSGISLL